MTTLNFGELMGETYLLDTSYVVGLACISNGLVCMYICTYRYIPQKKLS